MKNVIKMGLVIILATVIMGFGSRGSGDGSGKSNNSGNQGLNRNSNSYIHITDTTKYDVNESHIEDLNFMLQEEKLARDVYVTLNQVWGLRVFNNISQSEQQHMDAVTALLKKYDEEVDYNNDLGIFNSIEFTELYTELVEEGKKSRIDAVKVGIKIEELDIKDLKERIIGSTPDIEELYSNLIRGSENHLRAFKRQL